MSSNTVIPEKIRPVVRVNLDTMAVTVARKPGARGREARFGMLLHYREAPGRTPTGGRYTSRRVTVRRTDGTRFVGQYRNGADIVILRPESEAKR